MSKRIDDICPRMDHIEVQSTQPAAPPLYPASVYRCHDTDQAYQLLEGGLEGYVYQRQGHPNADLFAQKVQALHGAQHVAVASSGMAALATVVLSQLEPGDSILIGNQLYGESTILLKHELARLRIKSTEVDPFDLEGVAQAMTTDTKMVFVETISNPLLRVADIAGLASLCHQQGSKLLVDNTFATPVLCRPLELGADFVMESVSKMMNGHTDVMLGVLCGGDVDWQRVDRVLTTWGLASSPMDCWLSLRGLATMHLRVRQAVANAEQVARFLESRAEVRRVDYPGLASHVDHELASRQLDGFGNVVTFHLVGDRDAADTFIRSAKNIPFCPSLGEVFTTLSHPQSTSHRALSPAQRSALGINGGTIRLSVGIESADFIQESVVQGLQTLDL